MNKIVLAGTSVYGIENQGDDTMLSVFCRELKRNVPDVQITLLARYPSKGYNELYGIDKSIRNMDHDTRKESLVDGKGASRVSEITMN